MKVILTQSSNWEQYINSRHKLKVISGGPGALGANGSKGYFVPTDTKATQGGNDEDEDYPKVSIKGNIWGLCFNWKIELDILLSYTIYGKEISSNLKNELLVIESRKIERI